MDPVSLELTRLSATLDVTGLLLCSQKMLKARPLPLTEASILPRCCCLNAPLAKAHPISHATLNQVHSVT